MTTGSDDDVVVRGVFATDGNEPGFKVDSALDNLRVVSPKETDSLELPAVGSNEKVVAQLTDEEWEDFRRLMAMRDKVVEKGRMMDAEMMRIQADMIASGEKGKIQNTPFGTAIFPGDEELDRLRDTGFHRANQMFKAFQSLFWYQIAEKHNIHHFTMNVRLGRKLVTTGLRQQNG
jgi:hypothetical protein